MNKEWYVNTLRIYCERFGLLFREPPQSPLDDRDEFPDTVAAGFYPDFEQCGPVAISVTEEDGVIFVQVLERFADGRTLLEDFWRDVPLLKLVDATANMNRLHAE